MSTLDPIHSNGSDPLDTIDFLLIYNCKQNQELEINLGYLFKITAIMRRIRKIPNSLIKPPI